MITQCPRKTFSKAAPCYEDLSLLQKDIGCALLSMIPRRERCEILDVGMGTGWLTERIGGYFPSARLTGIDCAPGMVVEAKKKKIHTVLEADAQRLPFADGVFDLVISNCVYQWVEDMPKAFSEAFRVLDRGGDFCFSCFTEKTLFELRASIEKNASTADGQLHHWHLLTKESIRSALNKAGFTKTHLTFSLKVEKFEDLFSLISWLKTIGANRVKRNIFVGPRLLSRVSHYYQENFPLQQGIAATFEIIFGVAQK